MHVLGQEQLADVFELDADLADEGLQVLAGQLFDEFRHELGVGLLLGFTASSLFREVFNAEFLFLQVEEHGCHVFAYGAFVVGASAGKFGDVVAVQVQSHGVGVGSFDGGLVVAVTERIDFLDAAFFEIT